MDVFKTNLGFCFKCLAIKQCDLSLQASSTCFVKRTKSCYENKYCCYKVSLVYIPFRNHGLKCIMTCHDLYRKRKIDNLLTKKNWRMSTLLFDVSSRSFKTFFTSKELKAQRLVASRHNFILLKFVSKLQQTCQFY